MLKFIGNFVYGLIIGTLLAMWHYQDFTYQNISTVCLVIWLLLETGILIIIGASMLIPDSKEASTLFDQIRKNFSIVRVSWGFFKSIVMLVVLALTGYTFILGWYLVVHVLILVLINKIIKGE